MSAPIMDAMELVDHMLDKRGIRMTIGSAPCATFDLHFRQDFAALIESRDTAIREDERMRLYEIQTAIPQWTLAQQKDRDKAVRVEERERVIEECKAAIHAGGLSGDGGWYPFINKTLDSLKEHTDADAE
jgi:hypothetical protein